MEIEPLRLALFVVSHDQTARFFRRARSVLLQLTVGFALRLFSLLLLASALLLSFSESGARVSGHGLLLWDKLTSKPNAVAPLLVLYVAIRPVGADQLRFVSYIRTPRAFNGLNVMYAVVVRGLTGRRLHLAEVRLQEGEPLENALRRFKRKVQAEDIIKEVKRHSYYLKPGERRRVKQALARQRARKKSRAERNLRSDRD
jgi:small subunit ribosomal protein S21